MNCSRLIAVGACTMLALLTGCQQQEAKVDPARLAEVRSQFVLPAEPEGVESVLDVQESLAGPRQVVLVGQIGGVQTPWSNGWAAFVLADPVMLIEADEAEHVCTDAGCKFCASKAAEKLSEGLAYVQFVDPDGKVVPIDARELFDVSEKQTVVVRGRANIDSLGCLVVSADGLYIRR